jgi:hypothetical protein
MESPPLVAFPVDPQGGRVPLRVQFSSSQLLFVLKLATAPAVRSQSCLTPHQKEGVL